MSLPIFLHSGMLGAPILTQANGSMNALLNAILVNGFNTQSVVTATASAGVVSFNFASAPGFSALDTVTIAGASNSAVNGQWRVQSAAGNQVQVAIAGIPDGAVGGTITLKFSPLGWTRPFSGTGIGVYKQGGSATHKRFLRVYDNTAAADNYFYARAYENMTAVSSGTGPFPTTAQVAGNGASFNLGGVAHPAQLTWMILGTPRFFYFWSSWAADMTGNLSSFPAGSMTGFMFGELANVYKASDVYACMLGGGSNAFNSGYYLCRAYSGTGGSSSAFSVHGPAGNNATCFGLSGADAGSGHVLFGGPIVGYDNSNLGSIRGTLPGMLSLYHAVVYGGTYPNAHQLTGVPGVTGRVLLLSGHGAGASNETAHLMDEDWGDI